MAMRACPAVDLPPPDLPPGISELKTDLAVLEDETELLSEVVDREAGKSRRRRQKGRERILRVTTNTPTPR